MSQSQLANNTWSLLKNSEVLDVDGLSESAHKSFNTLHRWYSTERKKYTTDVVKTSDEIVRGSETYFDAISASVDMAKTGSIFSNQAAALCQKLSTNPKHMSARDLRAGVTSMLTIATKALNQAQVTEKKFGDVRIALINISANVQSRLAAVAEGQISIRSRSISWNKRAVVVASTPSDSAEATLSEAQDDLNNLLISVSHFSNWWANVVTQLGVIESIIPDAAAEGFDTFLGTNIHERWIDVGQKHDLYAQRIKLIEHIHSELVQAQRKNGLMLSVFKKRSADTGCIIC